MFGQKPQEEWNFIGLPDALVRNRNNAGRDLLRPISSGPLLSASRNGRVVSNFIMQTLDGEPITLSGGGGQTHSLLRRRFYAAPTQR